MSTISLTTDFGSDDWFVGTMKGAVLGINPNAALVDITHEVRPGDIRGGAFVLAAAYKFFPKGTVHLVVVDPGVGSARRAIAVQTVDYWFVGPDNGVLSWALAREQVRNIRALQNQRYYLKPVSRTFHGRDVFAPVAAQLSRGLAAHRLGAALRRYTRLAWPEPRAEGRGVRGEVIYIDRFGNAITNLDAERFGGSSRPLEVWCKGKRLCQVGECYQSVPCGQAVAVFGSSGFLEAAINGGSAEQRLGLEVGMAVTVRHTRSSFGLLRHATSDWLQ